MILPYLNQETVFETRNSSTCSEAKSHSAFEAEICSFTVGSNEMWFRDDDGGVLFTETVVSFVRNLLQLFPKHKFDRHRCFGLFELQFHPDIICISNHAMLQLTILAIA